MNSYDGILHHEEGVDLIPATLKSYLNDLQLSAITTERARRAVKYTAKKEKPKLRCIIYQIEVSK